MSGRHSAATDPDPPQVPTHTLAAIAIAACSTPAVTSLRQQNARYGRLPKTRMSVLGSMSAAIRRSARLGDAAKPCQLHMSRGPELCLCLGPSLPTRRLRLPTSTPQTSGGLLVHLTARRRSFWVVNSPLGIKCRGMPSRAEESRAAQSSAEQNLAVRARLKDRHGLSEHRHISLSLFLFLIPRASHNHRTCRHVMPLPQNRRGQLVPAPDPTPVAVQTRDGSVSVEAVCRAVVGEAPRAGASDQGMQGRHSEYLYSGCKGL